MKTDRHTTPTAVPDDVRLTDDPDAIDLTIEKLVPRLALTQIEGGGGYQGVRCSMGARFCGGRG